MSLKTNIIILVEGGFDILEAKTAIGVIKYSNRFNVLYIIDSITSGKTSFDVIGVGKNIPIVSSIEIAIQMAKESNINIDALLLGTAPKGGVLPILWRDIIICAMKNGLNIINPLHKLFNDDIEFKQFSTEYSVTMWDVRKPTIENRVANMETNNIKANLILTVGTDCNVGKMTTAIQIKDNLKMKGYNSVFVPTGQTGILIEGWGTAIDAVVADFVSGACEALVLKASTIANNYNDFIIIEGQGSLIHPGYSGASISLLHGTLPDALILCHHCSRKQVRRYTIPIPPLNEYIHIHNSITKNIKKCPIIAISLNTHGLNHEDALTEIERVSNETGLPTTDPVRYDSDIITKAIDDYFSYKLT
jgi:uncharacterized NAD-dependent epimerase/dehydratase family protein